MYCSVMFGGFNTREGVRWFKIFLEKISLKRMTSFNTREGVRWFGYTQETDVERLYYTVSIPVRV